MHIKHKMPRDEARIRNLCDLIRQTAFELKACKAIANEHLAQTLGYLRASSYQDAMLINFGASVIEFRKLIL